MKLKLWELEKLYNEKELIKNNKLLKVIEDGGWDIEDKVQELKFIFTDNEKFYRGEIAIVEGQWCSEILGKDEDSGIKEVEKRKITIDDWIDV